MLDGRPGEADSIGALVQFLESQGHEVRWTCTPDEIKECPWTMDAVLGIDSELWIVDHTRLMFAPKNTPWMLECERKLTAAIASIGRRVGYRVLLMCGDVPGDRTQRESTYARISEFAERCSSRISRGEVPEHYWFEEADGWAVQFNLADADSLTEDAAVALFAFPQSSEVDLQRQFEEVNWPVIEKKLSAQLAPADGRFDRRGLLLDQTYDYDRAAATNDRAFPNCVMTPTAAGAALRPLLARAGLALDGIWLLTPAGDVVSIDL